MVLDPTLERRHMHKVKGTKEKNMLAKNKRVVAKMEMANRTKAWEDEEVVLPTPTLHDGGTGVRSRTCGLNPP